MFCQAKRNTFSTSRSITVELSLLLQEKEHRPSSFEVQKKKERLNNSEILRYSRQLILPEIGVKGMPFET